MNSLNSVLLEGSVDAAPETDTLPDGSLFAMFTMISVRYIRSEDTPIKQELRFPVKAYGRTAEGCRSMLGPGRGIRVVGRLAQETDSHGVTSPYLVAETIEVKPRFDVQGRSTLSEGSALV